MAPPGRQRLVALFERETIREFQFAKLGLMDNLGHHRHLEDAGCWKEYVGVRRATSGLCFAIEQFSMGVNRTERQCPLWVGHSACRLVECRPAASCPRGTLVVQSPLSR